MWAAYVAHCITARAGSFKAVIDNIIWVVWAQEFSCQMPVVAVSHCQLHFWRGLTFKSDCTLLKAVNVGFFLCLQKIIWGSLTCSITALYYNCQSLCYILCDTSITSSFSCNFPGERGLAGSPLVFFLHLRIFGVEWHMFLTDQLLFLYMWFHFFQSSIIN